ncbi:MAG: hypothetical protein LIO94_04480, partial [Clostridiales bacterium]|nr:hypothetical protein [Clostridiales bacterium]
MHHQATPNLSFYGAILPVLSQGKKNASPSPPSRSTARAAFKKRTRIHSKPCFSSLGYDISSEICL